MQLDVISDESKTEIGSYFISNYPPFSVWLPQHTPAAHAALDAPLASTDTPLGLYVHIPFCRKRCKFCYFRVYTDKNSKDVDLYLNALAGEIALYADRTNLRDRAFDFVYFGGGTPSFLSSEQLQRLVDRVAEHWSWDRAGEVTFECEPGTLKKSKLETIKSIGVTRLSLGVEHFDDDILEHNGRAHKSPEIFRAYDWARDVGFDQINIDLIAGMIGDTEDGWKRTVDKALELDPDCVTIYQMEIPFNTVVARESQDAGAPTRVADWATKRAWVEYAFRQFESAGYVVSSAYTLVKPTDRSHFIYRDANWRGGDMIGTGVASFSHLSGVHFQNKDRWEDYIAAVDNSRLPIARALPLTERQRMIRELILLLKLGRIDAGYFRDKFNMDVAREFAGAIATLADGGFAETTDDRVTLTRAGLLRVDALLPYFFDPEYRDVRYT